MYMLLGDVTIDPVTTLIEDARRELNQYGFEVSQMPDPADCVQGHCTRCVVGTASGYSCFYGEGRSVCVGDTTFESDSPVAKLSHMFDDGLLGGFTNTECYENSHLFPTLW